MKTKTIVSTNSAPQAIGPYSQAIAAQGLLFASGQVALDLEGQLIAGDVKAQTRQALDNLQAVLEAGGSSLASVVKCTCFLSDFGDFAAMNEVYAEYFGDDPPARTTIGVAELPKGARVEIEAIALIERLS